MSTETLDKAIADFATGLLLRYFSAVALTRTNAPVVSIERDREILRLHWSLSQSVQDLATYVLEHRHEIQSSLGTVLRIEDGLVRGRLDAVRTLQLRRMSGVSTAVVSHEPLRSYDSGPNQVLSWVLAQAWSLATHFSTMTLDSPAYRQKTDETIQRLEQARKIQPLGQISTQSILNRRPTASAVVEATRSRKKLYRLAASAYKALLAVEAGDPAAIATMLKTTLLAPLESWRRFELAVALAVADELSIAVGQRHALNLLISDVRQPIARAGRFAIYWQWRTDYYRRPDPEPSEIVAAEVLGAFGLSPAADRPDLVIEDRLAGEVSAVVEVKYLAGDDASDRVRSAVHQLVRYGRGYVEIPTIKPLLGRSVIAVSQGLDAVGVPSGSPEGIPTVIDFEGITRRGLADWARRLASS